MASGPPAHDLIPGDDPNGDLATTTRHRSPAVVDGTMTTPLQRPGRRGLTPAPLVDAVQRIEAAEALEIPARVLTQLADRVLMSERVRSTLRGEPLGHALHPLLTDFPLGAWMSTSLLDLFAGRRARPAATGLLAFGVVAAVPTALAGLAEWREAAGRARRVGVVHAAVNGTALTLYATSLVARLRGRHRRAVGLGIAGGVVAFVGGYLGGHLSLVLKVGTADPVLAEGPVPEGQPPIG